MTSQMNPLSGGWSPNPEQEHFRENASSGPESCKASSSSGKKRPSRAVTRSVTALSAAQLDRKRANDREAQRAIRQRTKDHIDSLEKKISDIRMSQDATEEELGTAREKNLELEKENTYLRIRLGEPTFARNPNQREAGHLANDLGLLSVHSSSPDTQASASSLALSSSIPVKRSLSLANSQSSSSRQGSWQQQSDYAGLSPPTAIPASQGAASTPNVATWRSHENVANVQLQGRELQDITVQQQHSSFSTSNIAERLPWSPTSASCPYAVSEEQHRLSQYQSRQQQPTYVQSQPITHYPNPPHAQHSYQVAVPTPHTEFRSLSVASPAPYQPPQMQAPGFQQPPQYQMVPIPQVSPASEYRPQYSQMHPSQLPPNAYQQPPQSGQYPPLQHQQQQSQQYPYSQYPGG